MGFVDFFIHRVVFAIVCAIIIVLAGTVVIPSLPVTQYPQIALPEVVVAAAYVGASSEEVESGVTIPLEQQINGVQGMKYLTSSSSNDGSSVIVVTFDASRNIDLAAVDVQNRVNTALARLPVDVRNLGVTITKNSGSFVGAYALFTPDDRYDEKFMSNYADVHMKDRLKRIPGVADVLIFGERRLSMRLWLDPDRLAARRLSPVEVITALREQNVQVAAGSVGLPPTPAGLTYQISVRAIGRLVEASEFDEVVVKSLPDGTLIRLKDVGRAELGAESYSELSRWKGKRAVGLGIQQLPDSNALDVKRKVDAAVAQLAKEFPPGLTYETAFDTTAPVSASIKDVLITLLQAIALVIATIFIFLQTLRSTLIPAITIPVSLLGTFAFVKLFGFSINTLTLFGLTLATGLVVDDAIVVIENISRVMEQQHLSPFEAASKGMAEVTSAVVATSLVLVAVFVPVAFFPGTTGKIYQQFSLTIAFSIALSAFNAITLTPALSARLLRANDHGPEARKKGLFFRGFDRGFEALRRGYTRGLKVAIRFRAVTALLFLALLGATGWLFHHVPQSFIPDEDQGYFIVIVQGPEGSSLEVTSETMRGVEDLLAKVPEIQGCFSVPGFSLLGSGANKGAIFCSLIPWGQRTKPGQDAMSLVASLRGPLMGVGGAFVLPFSPPAIQGVGNVGGFQFEVEDQTSEPKIENLAKATSELMEAGNQDPNLRGVFSAFTANDPQILVEVDRDRAKALGVTLDELFATLQIYLGSAYVNDFVFGTRTYRVYVQADQQFRARPTDLTKFYVRSTSGEMVSLAELVKVTQTASAQSINHYNLFRSTEIQGSPAPGVSSGQALRAMEKVAREHLPPGFSFEWSGLSLEQLESGGQTLSIFALGIIFVFLVLAAQYESFVLPFIIILSVPVAMLGALLLQSLRGYSNDVFCQVGLVMLIGMSSKNAILIVEFARELREAGKPVIEAAVEAAETRLRPILMTSIAFLLGVVPLLVATGAGSVGRRSLGTTVFGGMLLSTFLNLFFIPVVYILVETLRERGGGARTAVAALSAAMLLLAAPRGAGAQSLAPRDAGDSLPPAPAVADPMLDPLPPPPRTVASWEEVVTLVRARSTDLRRAFDEVEIAEGQSRIALAGALTQVNAVGGLTHNFLRGPYPVAPGVSVPYPTRDVVAGQVALVQPVFSPRAWYAIGTARRGEEAARLTLEDRKRLIATDVAGALVAEFAAERVAELNRVGLRQALERLTLASRREALGSGSRLDVVRAEQDVDASRAAVVSGDESARQAREALGLALGIAEPVGAAPGLNIDGLVTDIGTGCRLVPAVDDRADLRALHTQVDIAARGEKDVWFQFSPTISLQSTLAASNDLLAIPSTTWNLAGVLTIPIWDGGARYGAARQAKAQTDEAEQNLVAQQRTVIIQIEQARRAVDVAAESRKVAVEAETHAREVDRMTQVGFLRGQGTSLDLVVSAGALRQAQINRALRDFDLVRARIDALLALADCGW